MDNRFHWSNFEGHIECVYDNQTVFVDDVDHWKQGFCRLMGWNDAEARRYVETAVQVPETLFHKSWRLCSPAERVAALKRNTQEFYKISPVGQIKIPQLENVRICGTEIDQVILSDLRFAPNYQIVGNSYLEHGILVEVSQGAAKPVEPPKYEEQYFEGSEPCYGYGNYSSQSEWRLEKARRLVRQIHAMMDYRGIELPRRVRLLDVGSGYGFFRKAASESGWFHDGIDVSHYAAKVARETFGFETFVDNLADFHPNKKYDLITLFDVVEHLLDPISVLREGKRLLKKNGICVVRTPNVNALECVVFDQYYHSIKPEHLQYFSPKSLCYFMMSSGIKPLAVNTEAHLLRGLLGWDLALYESILQGSDIMAFGINEE